MLFSLVGVSLIITIEVSILPCGTWTLYANPGMQIPGSSLTEISFSFLITLFPQSGDKEKAFYSHFRHLES